MFAPGAAFASFGTGFQQGMRDADEDTLRRMKLDQAKWDLMGAEAAGSMWQGPQPPMPGQPSVPNQPPLAMPGPPQGGMPPAAPMAPPLPGPSPGAGAPPAASPAPSAAVGGMPQWDLNTMAARIRAVRPNLPPQAMFSAMVRNQQLLEPQSRMELARLGMEMRKQSLELDREKLDETRSYHRSLVGRKTDAENERQDEVSAIATDIANGNQPPTLTGLYGKSAAVRAALAKQGFNLAKATQEWKAAERQILSLNGPQMTRYVGLAGSVVSTIDEVNALAEEMQNSGIPLLNRAKLASYIQLQGNSEKGQLAARYLGAVNTLKEEFANLANGGYAPTEPAWTLANKQINEDYGVKELRASLTEVQRLIRYRINAIPNMQTLGPGGQNRYTGQSGQGAGLNATAPAPTPGKSDRMDAAGGVDEAAAREAAKKAGYTDAEIDEFLRKRRGK